MVRGRLQELLSELTILVTMMNTFNNIDDNDDNFVDNLQLHTAPLFDPIMGLQRCDMR